MRQELVYGYSKHFTALMALVDGYAASPWPVMIQGETGVGKELVAGRLHERSVRRDGPFVPLNCAAVPPALFESELFGYERGAFSGAVNGSRGLLRHANGGTVFLDEIGDLDLLLQVKLLRFLDSGEVRPVGATRAERVDVRLIAATNVNLHAAVRDGRFRLDLLERLSVLTLAVPPLRERPEDVPLLARHFLRQLDTEPDDDALDVLVRYDWPGNVRQLRNLMVRATVRGRGRVARPLVEAILREEVAAAAELEPRSDETLRSGSLAEIEKEAIVSRLKRCHGNRKKTAETLGIAKSTLHDKLRRWQPVATLGH